MSVILGVRDFVPELVDLGEGERIAMHLSHVLCNWWILWVRTNVFTPAKVLSEASLSSRS